MAYGEFSRHPHQTTVWATLPAGCPHCYCQPGTTKGDVEHAKCCKCPDQMAVKLLGSTNGAGKIPTGQALREWRNQRGLTQTEAAQRCSVSPNTWSRWEQGRMIPTRHIEGLREIVA